MSSGVAGSITASARVAHNRQQRGYEFQHVLSLQWLSSKMALAWMAERAAEVVGFSRERVKSHFAIRRTCFILSAFPCLKRSVHVTSDHPRL